MVIRRFFRTLMSFIDFGQRRLRKVFMSKSWKNKRIRLPEGFDRMLWGDLMIMFNQGDTADFWDTQQDWKLISWKLHNTSTHGSLSQMLELKLETEEESSMALELIKFVKQQLEEFEDSNDDDHGEEERV
ncbi:hypothetical protein Tco_0195714 [Tanacetum coccineum]